MPGRSVGAGPRSRTTLVRAGHPGIVVDGRCAVLENPGVYPDVRARREIRRRNAPATPGDATVTALDGGWSGGRAVAYHAGCRHDVFAPSARRPMWGDPAAHLGG